MPDVPKIHELDPDTVPVALVQLGEDRRVETLNSLAETLFGVSRQAAIGKTLTQITHPDTGFGALIDRAVRSQGPVTDQALHLFGPNISGPPVQHTCVRITSDDKVTLAFMPSPNKTSTNNDVDSLASFGSILGHEVKNPLAGLSGAAQLLLRSAREDQSELLHLILTESERITRLVDELSAFELFSNPKPAACNIHAILDKVIRSEQVVCGDDVKITRNFDPSLPAIHADADHIHEVFQNLIRNAREALVDHARDGQAVIAVSTRFSLDRRAANAKTKGDGRFVEATITDNGPGIAQDGQDRIFEMFHTTKSSGSGLGLTIVNQVIQAHEGHIKVDSEPGRTSFSVYLPVARAS